MIGHIAVILVTINMGTRLVALPYRLVLNEPARAIISIQRMERASVRQYAVLCSLRRRTNSFMRIADIAAR